MKIKVMVVDDSNFMRKATAKILSAHPQIEVVSLVSSGEDALTKMIGINPDVITLDYHLGGINGIETLREIMKVKPTPVIMLSGETKEGAAITLKALQMGAIDFVAKPDGSLSMDLSSIQDEMINKVITASLFRMDRVGKNSSEGMPSAALLCKKLSSPEKSMLFIASSTGGVQALFQIVPRLPSGYAIPVLIVQHMPPLFTKSLARNLDTQSSLKVKEAESGEHVRAGVVYIAPGGWQTKLLASEGAVKIMLDKSDSGNRLKPCADITMKSIAEVYGKKSVGIILTGMGNDGTKGAAEMKKRGAAIYAQDEDSSCIFGMPRSVIDAGHADAVIGLNQVVDCILSLQ